MTKQKDNPKQLGLVDPFAHRSEGGALTDIGPFGPFGAASFRMLEDRADKAQHELDDRVKAAA